MDWWWILLIFIVVVIILWWALSRQTDKSEKVSEAAPVKTAPKADDDLTKIEGIGPKVSGLLKAAGITSFADLEKVDFSKLEGILDAAGSIYKAMDSSSWPKQAGLAAAGDWDALQKLQDELVGGK